MAQTLRNLNKVDGAGRHVLGTPFRGVLGANIPTTSIFYGDLNLPADALKEYSGRILTWPSSGVYYLKEDGTGSFTPANDGTFTATVELVENGTDIGVKTETFQSGLGIITTTPGNAVASGAPATISNIPGGGAQIITTTPGNAVAAGAPATVVSSVLVRADLQITYILTGSAIPLRVPTRTVVFSGGKRTVTFGGGKRIVRFLT